MRSKLFVLYLLVAATSCAEQTPSDPEAAALLPTVLLRTPPKPKHASDLQFEDSIRLLGYDVSTDKPELGRPFKVTWYWQVLEPLASGYQLFTHVSDGKHNRVNLDSERVLRRVYPEAKWQKGDFLRDEQEITLPSDWNAEEVAFFLGFYSGEKRLAVKHGSSDGAGRAEALRLHLATVIALPPVTIGPLPRLIARHTTGPVALDGKLNEPDWRLAQSTGVMLNTMTGAPGSFQAHAQVLYDADAFYCAFVVTDDYIKSTFQKDDDHLWEQDTVEIMFDPDGDARNYFELQVSPSGRHFDTRYDTPRIPRPFGHVDWSSRVTAAVELNGTLDDDVPDQGYTVELRVPWTAFDVGTPAITPPKGGDEWRLNFFVMDARIVGQRAVGWSPPRVGDFHTLEKFGRVFFPVPAASGIAPSSAAPPPVTAPSPPVSAPAH